MPQVFVSYSRKDRDFVRQLNDALIIQKREAWVDWKDIPLTAEWQQEILANIEAAENFVFVISPEATASLNCRREIDHAVANNKRMVPILRRHVPDDAIPAALSKFQRIDFSENDDFDARFATLLAALDADLAWVNAHTRLLTRAKEWEREGKDKSFLLRGKDLREAERWVAKSSEKDPKPTTLQSQYILASRQSATKLQTIIIGAVAIALLIAVGLAVYAFTQKNLAQRETKEAEHQRAVADANATEAQKQKKAADDNAEEAMRQRNTAVQNEKKALRQEAIAKEETAIAQRNARESKARELAAFSAESLNEDPERSLLLSMYAVNSTLRFREAPVPAAEDTLHQAILSSQVRITMRGHSGSVNGVAFSPDGSRLATASDDKTAKVWDVETGKELLTLRGDSSAVRGVAFSPDGKRLATASWNQTAKVRDAESGKELLTLGGHSGSVNGVAFSPDGERLATASDDKTAKVWDAETGRELLTLRGHSSAVRAVAFSLDGKRLASASVDHTAKVWDAESGKELLTLRGHSGPVNKVAFSPDGKRLATASEDQTAKVWDAERGTELLTLRGHSGSVNKVAFSPDGKRLATANANGTVQVHALDLRELLNLARSRITRTFTAEECLRYFQSETCPPLP